MLKPVLKKWDSERQAWTWGLLPEDFQKVQRGYACSRCLEEFESYVSVCPVCKEPNVPAWAELPAEWRGY